MGTRPGQLDAGVLLWLMTERHMDAAALTDLLYRRSGLAGLSGLGGDMRTLQASAEPAAREAVDYFIARLREQIGAMAAALGGIDALVFTAGIGEHDPIVRARTIAGLGFLGLTLDDEANAGHGRANGGRISPPHATARVWVIPTNEEQVIARHLRAVLDGGDDAR
jgi:acetate kinase